MLIDNEPLEIAEQRYDRVMNNPASTHEQRFEAVVRLACRAYRDFKDADQSIQGWVTVNRPPV